MLFFLFLIFWYISIIFIFFLFSPQSWFVELWSFRTTTTTKNNKTKQTIFNTKTMVQFSNDITSIYIKIKKRKFLEYLSTPDIWCHALVFTHYRSLGCDSRGYNCFYSCMSAGWEISGNIFKEKLVCWTKLFSHLFICRFL